MSAESLKYWLALLRAPAVGARTFLKLLDAFSDLSQVFATKNKKLLEKWLPEAASAYLASPDWEDVEKELQWATQPHHNIITLQDPRYPTCLKAISDPPPVLYIKGQVSALQTTQIAIVGSRKSSFTGQEQAFQFAYQLAQNGITITSGLAKGIDSYGHQGALKAGGQTIAVLGSSMDQIYPREHIGLSEKIASNGAIISEFPLKTCPLARHFPQRNRIISGLSRGVLVVEATLKSGSLVTARLANEQGREVFAIPGAIQNPLSKGCHYLIREGAKLVENIEDILEEL